MSCKGGTVETREPRTSRAAAGGFRCGCGTAPANAGRSGGPGGRGLEEARGCGCVDCTDAAPPPGDTVSGRRAEIMASLTPWLVGDWQGGTDAGMRKGPAGPRGRARPEEPAGGSDGMAERRATMKKITPWLAEALEPAGAVSGDGCGAGPRLGGGRGRRGEVVRPFAVAVDSGSRRPSGCSRSNVEDDGGEGSSGFDAPPFFDLPPDFRLPPLPGTEDHPGHAGVGYLRFRLLVDTAAGEDVTVLDEDRATHGTQAQLLRDAQSLGAAAVRQLEDADTFLSTLWRGCPTAAADHFAIGEGWACPPVDVSVWGETSPGCADAIPTTCPGAAAASCELPGGAPPVLTEAFLQVARDPAVGSIDVLPTLFAQSNVPTAVEYEWRYDAHGTGQALGSFWLGNVDQYFDLATEHERAHADRLAQEFIRQLVADASYWAADRPAYVCLSNELDGTVPDEDLAWLALRTSEILAACRPEVRRIFPGLASVSDVPPPGGDAFADCVAGADPARSFAENARCRLDRLFFHIVRSALVAQAHDVDPAASDRFVELLGEGIRGGAARYFAWKHGEGAPFDGEVLVGTDLAAPEAEADYAVLREDLRAWSRERGLTCPFDVLDFHWYNNGYKRGEVSFLYIGWSRLLVETLREVMGRWWAEGEVIPIWCTETGVSSARSPGHYYEKAEFGVMAAGTFQDCSGHLPVPNCVVAGDALLGSHETFEYRVAPAQVFDAHSGPFDLADRSWDWVFVSETEQARQMCIRLSFFSGVGVDRALWHTNEAPPVKTGNEVQEFYGFGLTEDTAVETSVRVGDATASLREVTPQPVYSDRQKKPAFCAMQRWSRYLGKHRWAQVVHPLDGLDLEEDGVTRGEHRGYYAVLFALDGDSEYPFALVVWADGQAYEGCLAGAPEACGGTRTLVYRARTSRDVENLSVLQVSTVPSMIEGGAAGTPLLDPCSTEADPDAAEDSYRALPLGFGPDVELPMAFEGEVTEGDGLVIGGWTGPAYPSFGIGPLPGAPFEFEPPVTMNSFRVELTIDASLDELGVPVFDAPKLFLLPSGKAELALLVGGVEEVILDVEALVRARTGLALPDSLSLFVG